MPPSQRRRGCSDFGSVVSCRLGPKPTVSGRDEGDAHLRNPAECAEPTAAHRLSPAFRLPSAVVSPNGRSAPGHSCARTAGL